MTTLGERLKIYRKKAGLSQREAAEKLSEQGVKTTQATLSRYENNEFDTPANVIRTMTKIYNVDASLLLFDPSEL